MGFISNKPYFSPGGGTHSMHAADILKHAFADGKIKVFEDEKGAAQKVVIEAEGGMVIVRKEYEQAANFSRYKKLEVVSDDGEPLGALDIITDVKTMLHPVSRFFFGRTTVGSGSGDVGMAIAAKLVGESGIDPRLLSGSTIDPEVIDTIKQMLQQKFR